MFRVSGFVSKYAIRSFSTAAPSTGASSMTPTKKALMKLRRITGYSYVNCRKAVDKFGPDNIEEATAWLRELARKEGWAKAAKLSNKKTAEGLLSISTKGNVGAVVELNCQTDFVARGDDFKNLITNLTEAILNHAKTISTTINIPKGEVITVPVVADEIKMSNGVSISEAIALTVGKLGENITTPVMNMIFAEEGVNVSGHSHPKEKINNCEVGRFISVVGIKRDPTKDISFPSEKLGEQICQHIIGMRPESLGEPPKEGEGIKVESKESQQEEKQGEDDLNSYDNTPTTSLSEDETGLLRQQFMLNPSQSVFSYMEGHGAQIINYLRMEVGEKSIE